MLFSKKNTGIPIQFLGLPVVILEDNGTILDINDYFLELLSKEKDSVIGLHYRDIEYFRPIEQHITRKLFQSRFLTYTNITLEINTLR